MHSRRLSLILAAVLALTLFAAPVANAQQTTAADSGGASAFGARLDTLLGEVLGPTPSVEAAFPPGEEASDALLEVPADPVLNSGTLSVTAETDAEPVVEATLQDVVDGQAEGSLPDAWNSRGHAIAEDLTALEDTLTAEVIQSEALAGCVDREAVFATGADFVNARLGGQELLDQLLGAEGLALVANEPNEVILDELGIRVVAWETNWDGATGTSDGSDTVFVNALRVSIDLLDMEGGELPPELQELVDQLLGGAGEDPTGEDPTGEDPLGGQDPTGEDPTGEDPLGGQDPTGEDPTGEDPLGGAGQDPTGEDPTGGEDPLQGLEGPQQQSSGSDSAPQPEAETLETEALADQIQNTDDVQIQQQDGTLDLIISHSEAEANCAPPEPEPEPEAPPTGAPEPADQPLPVTGGGAFASLAGLVLLLAGAGITRFIRRG